MIWRYGQLIKIKPIPHHRLTMMLHKSPDVRIVTDHDHQGEVMATPKFVIHTPESYSGSPLAVSIMRAQAYVWLFKKIALSDWATFVEVFGMPIRIGRYDASTTTTERADLRDMLKNLGANAWAMISRAADIEINESSSRGTSPHEALINFLSREQAIVWLGGNLTTDTSGGTGTFAAADVQSRTKDDLLADDIESEQHTIEEQIFRPMVRFRFPGLEAPVPTFRRIVPENRSRLDYAELIGKAQQTGIEVPRDWAHDVMGIPKPTVDDTGRKEAVLDSLDALEQGIVEGGAFGA